MTITQINPQSVYQETPGKTTKQNKTKQKTTKKTSTQQKGRIIKAMSYSRRAGMRC